MALPKWYIEIKASSNVRDPSAKDGAMTEMWSSFSISRACIAADVNFGLILSCNVGCSRPAVQASRKFICTLPRNRAEVRASNPLGRIPALVLDSGETLIDSNAIIDHLDEVYGHDRPLTPRGGADRRAVLKVAATLKVW